MNVEEYPPPPAAMRDRDPCTTDNRQGRAGVHAPVSGPDSQGVQGWKHQRHQEGRQMAD